MKKLTIILSVCLWAVAIQAQNFGSEAMRKLQMAEFAISNFYVDKVDEDKLVEEAIIKMLAVCTYRALMHASPINTASSHQTQAYFPPAAG